MKNHLLLCLFLFALNTQAQEENSEFKTETIAFIKLTGAGAAFESAIAQIGANVPDANKQAYTSEALATLDGLYAKMAGLYMEEFTQSEIKELTIFYNTNLGKKLADKQLGLMEKAMMFGQTWGMQVAQMAQSYSEVKE